MRLLCGKNESRCWVADTPNFNSSSFPTESLLHLKTKITTMITYINLDLPLLSRNPLTASSPRS
jgi:hypothetical protein